MNWRRTSPFCRQKCPHFKGRAAKLRSPRQHHVARKPLPQRSYPLWKRTGRRACHQLEHELGGMFDVAHGAGLAAVWGSWRASSSPPIRHALPAMPAGYGISGKKTTRKPPWPGSWPQKISSRRLRCPPPSPNWDCPPQRNSWIPWPSNVLTKTPAPSAISKNWPFRNPGNLPSQPDVKKGGENPPFFSGKHHEKTAGTRISTGFSAVFLLLNIRSSCPEPESNQ